MVYYPFPKNLSSEPFQYLNSDQDLSENNDSNQSASFDLYPTPDLDELISKVEKLGKINDLNNTTILPDPIRPSSQALLDQLIKPALKQPIPPDLTDLKQQVEFIDQKFDAKHVVYLIDVGPYQLKGTKSIERLEKIKVALLDSINKLSSNSYFNVVMCWNLRELTP